LETRGKRAGHTYVDVFGIRVHLRRRGAHGLQRRQVEHERADIRAGDLGSQCVFGDAQPEWVCVSMLFSYSDTELEWGSSFGLGDGRVVFVRCALHIQAV
jgi:hypothetical protein